MNYPYIKSSLNLIFLLAVRSPLLPPFLQRISTAEHQSVSVGDDNRTVLLHREAE